MTWRVAPAVSTLVDIAGPAARAPLPLASCCDEIKVRTESPLGYANSTGQAKGSPACDPIRDGCGCGGAARPATPSKASSDPSVAEEPLSTLPTMYGRGTLMRAYKLQRERSGSSRSRASPWKRGAPELLPNRGEEELAQAGGSRATDCAEASLARDPPLERVGRDRRLAAGVVAVFSVAG